MTKNRQNREENNADTEHQNKNDYEMSATDMYAYADDDPMAGAQTTNDQYVTEEGMQADANTDFFDDYDDEEDRVMKDSNRQSRTKFDDEDDDDSYEDGSGGKFSNDDDDSDDDDEFFATKRKSNRGRYNNDAIKIISTPLGKVGIVYEQPQTSSTSSHSKSTPTDFDSLSPASVSGRHHSSHPKITPVLTADGKVALLYRGDSESTKYEPIKNFTNTFNLYDNKTNVDSKIKKYEDSEEDMGWDEDDEEIVSNTSSSESKKNAIDEQSTNNVDGEQPVTETPELSQVDSGIDNSVLPMINKPLSEVLGIKKNQFTQFRIKDNEQMTTPPSVLPPFVYSSGGESKSINHENPSINLGGFYNSRAAADFDFGRDATMLDAKMHLPISDEENKGEGNQLTEEDATIAASDVLAKTEVVNLAIIPHFDEEFEKQQHLRDHELRRLHHRQRHRYRHINEDISNIHCIMQAMMGVAAVSTVFGMLGAMFKQKIIDAIRSLHW